MNVTFALHSIIQFFITLFPLLSPGWVPSALSPSPPDAPIAFSSLVTDPPRPKRKTRVRIVNQKCGVVA